MTSLIAQASSGLRGELRAPGDKSISHRALIMGALSVGRTVISGLLEGEDVLCTASALGNLGAVVSRRSDGLWQVHGRGVGGFDEPESVLDLGNSGTGVRLLMGVGRRNFGHHLLHRRRIAPAPPDGARDGSP